MALPMVLVISGWMMLHALEQKKDSLTAHQYSLITTAGTVKMLEWCAKAVLALKGTSDCWRWLRMKAVLRYATTMCGTQCATTTGMI